MRPDLIGEDPQVLNLWKLGAALTGEMPLDTPIKSLMVYNSNPAIMISEQDKVLAGLAREDLFTVVSEHFITDTAKYADILLPATTQVEQEDIMFSWGHLYLSYNNKAIAPIGEAVSNTELFRRLAKLMGFGDDPYFTRSDEQMIAESVIWDNPALEGITLDELKKKGYMRLNKPAPDVYAPHAEGGFHTPSGKTEIKASAAAGGNFVVPLFRQGYGGKQIGGAVDSVPHYIPPRESPQTNPELAAHFPLSLISPKSHAFLSSSFGNMERQKSYSKDVRLVMHPHDAEPRSIVSGQNVRVFNGRGAFVAKVDVSEDILPGVVAAPAGFWRDKERANTVHAITSPNWADLGAAPTFSDLLVEVETIQQPRLSKGLIHDACSHRQLPALPLHRMR